MFFLSSFSMTDWAQIFTGLLFFACERIHQVRTVFDKYQMCTVPLRKVFIQYHCASLNHGGRKHSNSKQLAQKSAVKLKYELMCRDEQCLTYICNKNNFFFSLYKNKSGVACNLVLYAILSGGHYCICNNVRRTVLHMQSCPPGRCWILFLLKSRFNFIIIIIINKGFLVMLF